MLGLNLLYAGLALCINGIGYYRNLNKRVLASVNLLVGLLILFNSLLGIINAQSLIDYSNMAGGLLFAFNYLIIAMSHFLKDENFEVFGWFELFAAVVSLVFCIQSFVIGIVWLGLLWLSWFVLWLGGFLDSVCKIKFFALASPILLLFNGLITTGLFGFLILFGAV